MPTGGVSIEMKELRDKNLNREGGGYCPKNIN